MSLLRSIMAMLVFCLSAQALASDAQIRTYYNQVTDTFRYVVGHKQDADIYQGEKTGWVLQVSEAQGSELPENIHSQTLQSSAEIKQVMAELNESLLEKGYMDVDAMMGLNVGPDMGLSSLNYRNSATAKEGGNPVWRVTNQWNWDWELKYAKWVSNQDQFFFIKHRMPTDCADVVISLRWIFARMNGLPAANTLTTTGEMVGNMTESRLWSHLPTHSDWTKDQRFLAALSYIRDNTYTGSLRNDSYPIAINRSSLIPGSHHLEMNPQGGHAFIVKNVTIGLPTKIEYMESTLPVEIRRLRVKEYAYAAQPSKRLGFLRTLWPVREGNTWSFKTAEEHPGFSMEQYQPEFMGAQSVFAAAVSNHLRGVNNNEFNMKSFKTTVEVVRQKLLLRAKSVYEASVECRRLGCNPGTASYDEYSTPVADSKLKADIQTALKAVEAQRNNRDVINEWNKFRNLQLDIKMGGRTITMGQAVDLLMSGRTNSDPRSSIAVRWGL